MSVSALNEYVKELLEDDPELAYCEVEGEISNFKHYISSGHMYFTLKDDNCAISAIMYKGYASELDFLPEDGMKVIVRGNVTLYSKNGNCQIIVKNIKKSGIGDLYAAYEQLKKRLSSEGLFDNEFKKSLPRYPKKVGVITSKYGAALQDILNISERRYPLAEITVFPTLVQGPSAAQSLCKAVEYFDQTDSVDVIIIGRGGGSIEDLWCFNDEKLARKIFDCKIPIVSAVGHETDYTISDFVADMRAPTPSAAAELVFPDMNELRQNFAYFSADLSDAVHRMISEKESLVREFSSGKISVHLNRRLMETEDKIKSVSKTIKNAVNRKFLFAEEKLVSNAALLDAKSPLKIFTKGYSVITDSNGSVIKKSDNISVGDMIGIRFAEGKAQAQIIEVED